MTPQQIEAARQVLATRPNQSQAQVAPQECQDKAFCAGTFDNRNSERS